MHLERSQPRRNLKPSETLESWEPLERSKQREQEVGRVTQGPLAHFIFLAQRFYIQEAMLCSQEREAPTFWARVLTTPFIKK